MRAERMWAAGGAELRSGARRAVYVSAMPHDYRVLTQRLSVHVARDFTTRNYRVGPWAVSVKRYRGTRTPIVTIRRANEVTRPFWNGPEDEYSPFEWRARIAPPFFAREEPAK